MLEKAFAEERKMAPRLALAFALVSLGNRDTSQFSPLTYLVNSLNSKSYRGVAEPYLIEVARDPAVRQAVAGYLARASKEEKIGISRIIAATGDRTSLAALEQLAKDPDPEIAQEGVRSLRILRSRVP
jgi:hypothetical protein